MSRNRKLILAAAVFLMGLSLFLPIWKIEIWAAQYPEGLFMHIWANQIDGSVDSINILNHYIGMKHIIPSEIPELKIIPWVLGLIVALGALVIFLNRLFWAKLWFGFVCLLGVVGFVDFYRWGYDYGHNLSPTAPIKIPGLSYQPPLLGEKILLNIRAYSFPDWGGWALFLGLFLAFCAIFWESLTQNRWTKKIVHLLKTKSNGEKIGVVIFLLIGFCGLISCTAKPEPLKVGVDHCEHCHMQISDAHFGAEIVTKKGRNYKFDSVQCMRNFKSTFTDPVAGIYVEDYLNPGTLIDIEEAHILSGSQIKGPMGPGLVASKDEAALKLLIPKFSGQLTDWKNLSESPL